METTFEVHKCLDIVLDTEPNPRPMNDDGTSIESVDDQLRAAMISWKIRHVLAKEAVLKSLETPNLLKIIAVRMIADLDFNEIFTLVVRIESVRIIFPITTINDLYILHIDCKNDFLYGKSNAELYITQPE